MKLRARPPGKRMRWVAWVAVKAAVAAIVACSGSSGTTPAPGAPDVDASVTTTAATPTYYRDVKPIVDAHCAECHVAGGIAPFALTSYDLASEHKTQMASAVRGKVMPPWPPSADCTDYTYNRSLSADEVATIGAWADQGGAPGNPDDFHPLQGVATQGVSRVDLRLKMPEAFTPTLSPDEYRCFLLDWPATSPAYITGLGAVPGQASIVHHMLVFDAPPDQVAVYQAADDAAPGPGYPCFAGPLPTSPGGGSPSAASIPGMLGGWAPGSLGSDFPAGTGLEIAPGSKIVLQVHYNTLSAPAAADQSELDLKIDTSVDKKAFVMPWTNPQWPSKHTMAIHAGDPDATYAFAFDALTGISTRYPAVSASAPVTVYSAALHMHLHGTHTRFTIQHAGGDDECMLDIARWNFHWQGSYGFDAPKTIQPGDHLNLECHWDNSAANQPIVAGAPTPIADLNWGEGTTDEMCIGFLYMTQ